MFDWRMKNYKVFFYLIIRENNSFNMQTILNKQKTFIYPTEAKTTFQLQLTCFTLCNGNANAILFFKILFLFWQKLEQKQMN